MPQEFVLNGLLRQDYRLLGSVAASVNTFSIAQQMECSSFKLSCRTRRMQQESAVFHGEATIMWFFIFKMIFLAKMGDYGFSNVFDSYGLSSLVPNYKNV